MDMGSFATMFAAGVFFWFGARIKYDKPLDMIDRFAITCGLWMLAGCLLLIAIDSMTVVMV